MAFSSIPSADIAAGKPVDVDLMANIKDNDDALNGSLGGQSTFNIPNGDMETDADVSGFPDNWAATTYAGGTASLETTAPINGYQSMKFVHPGGVSNGGGYADSDYMPCGYGAPFRLSWLHSCTAATMKNQVIIRYFDEDKVTIGADATVYDSITNPTTATQFTAICNPPTTARFYKVRLVGGENSVDVAGTALFDAVSVERARIRSYTVPSSVSSVVFTDIVQSKKLKMYFTNFTHGGISFGVQVSSDNGTTWVTASSYFSAADDAVGATGTGNFLFGGVSTTSMHGEATIQNLGFTDYTRFQIDTTTRTTTPGATNFNKSGILNTTTAYNAIRLIPSTSTIDTGTIIIEELY